MLAGVAARIRKAASFDSLSLSQCNSEAVRASLLNSWGTEVLLALAGSYGLQDEIVRLSNNWAVVQLYYAVCHSTRALILAKKGAPPQTHPSTRSQFVTLWVQPAGASELTPLSLAYGARGPANVPAGVVIDEQMHEWTTCTGATCWSLAVKALRTTRSDELKRKLDAKRGAKGKARRDKWLKDEQDKRARGGRVRSEPQWTRPNLTRSEKQEVDRRLRDYSLIDYLFRMRIRSNYDDVSMFSDGPEDDTVSTRVHADLIHIAAASSLTHELHIMKLVGRETFLHWVDEWLTNNYPSPVLLGLRARRDLL